MPESHNSPPAVSRAQRILGDPGEQSAWVLGSLWLTGASFTLLSFFVAEPWPNVRDVRLVWAAIAAAYTVAGGLYLSAWRERQLSQGLAEVLVFLGSLTIMMLTMGVGPNAAPAYGGFFSYVAAYSFLYFPPLRAAAQIIVSMIVFAIALDVIDAPAAWAAWSSVIGIALGGAGLVGVLGSRARMAAAKEADAARQVREASFARHSFLRAVSHELRSPLTVIVGVANVLNRGQDALTADERTKMTATLVAQAGRLDGMVKDLLDIDRMEREHVEARRQLVALRPFVKQIVTQAAMREHHLDVTVSDAMVSIEPTTTERILANLLSNAARHTPPGTRVRICTTLHGDDLVIEVADNGPGLPDMALGTIFDPFVQGPGSAEMASPGTGIGLTLVSHFARMHGGEATAVNLPEGGVLFTVRLARARASAAPLPPPPARDTSERSPARPPAMRADLF